MSDEITASFTAAPVTLVAGPTVGRSPSPALPVFIDRFRQEIRRRHYAARTERAYVEWLHRFCAWFDGRAVENLGEPELRRFLADLASRSDVTPMARNQAHAALLLFFHHVLGLKVDCSDGLHRAQQDGSEGPGVLARDQVACLLAAVDAAHGLPLALIYGTGLRVAEVLALRVRDVDFDASVIHVREGRNADNARTVALPSALAAPLWAQLEAVRQRHAGDLLKGAGFAQLPEEVRVQTPQAVRGVGWQWVFQAGRLQRDPVTQEGRRPHLHETVLQRALVAAARSVGITGTINPQTLRHSHVMHAQEKESAAPAAA